jgi:hypothetical protein
MPKIRLFGDQAIVQASALADDVVEPVEVTDPVPATHPDSNVSAGSITSHAAPAAPEDAVAPFDPAEHTVAEVLELLGECTDGERAAVVAAERAGKNRSSITSHA